MHHDFDFGHMFLFGGFFHWIWALLFWGLVILAIIGLVRWLSKK